MYLGNTLIKKYAKFHEAGTNRKKVMSGELKGREKKKERKKEETPPGRDFAKFC